MRIVVDAGHGGADPGAIGVGGYEEKEYTLGQAHVFASLACRRGFELELTREVDVFVPLRERARIANDVSCDLFLSFHFNAATTPDASGTIALHYAGSNMGRRYAEEIVEEVSPLDGVVEPRERAVALPDPSFRRTRSGAPFVPYVLKATYAPAVILETEFGTDPDAVMLLGSVDYQVSVAEAVLRAIEQVAANS